MTTVHHAEHVHTLRQRVDDVGEDPVVENLRECSSACRVSGASGVCSDALEYTALVTSLVHLCLHNTILLTHLGLHHLSQANNHPRVPTNQYSPHMLSGSPPEPRPGAQATRKMRTLDASTKTLVGCYGARRLGFRGSLHAVMLGV